MIATLAFAGCPNTNTDPLPINEKLGTIPVIIVSDVFIRLVREPMGFSNKSINQGGFVYAN